MSRGRPKTLSEEDRILWDMVARSVTPLAGRKAPPKPPAIAEADMEALDRQEEAGAVTAADRARPPPAPARPGIIDRPTHGKLAKGRIAIEARVDLHGMTQAQAHMLLLSFLTRARDAGLRHVLVITGKGPGGEGVLRRAVPEWLAGPAFRGLVGAHRDAARQHGGTGALYVRLRAREERRG